MSFDSHAHLDSVKLLPVQKEILSGLAAAGVEGCLNVGCDLPSSVASVRLAEEQAAIWAAVGSHPDDADRFSEGTVSEYCRLAKNPRVCAIGEIGLDYHYPDGPGRESQKRCFTAQLALAEELDMPVILHIRDSFADALDILRQFPGVRGVFHCFSGSAELALELVKKGWYIGFTGVVTFKNARNAVETAAAIPADRILAETDCPYMAPEPFRGKPCDSRLLPYTVAKLAQIRGISPEEMSRITTENTRHCFGISI